MEIRKEKPDGHETILKVIKILDELREFHPQYNLNDWCGAYMGVIALAFRSKYTYEEFKEDMRKMIEYYEHVWKDEPTGDDI